MSNYKTPFRSLIYLYIILGLIGLFPQAEAQGVTVISISPVVAQVSDEVTIAGARFGPISVTVDGLTASSAQFFLPTFAGEGGITKGSFAGKVDLPTGAGPWSVAIDPSTSQWTCRRDASSAAAERRSSWCGRRRTTSRG